MSLINRNLIRILLSTGILVAGIIFSYKNYIELKEIADSIKIENILLSIFIMGLAIIYNAYKFSAVLILSLRYRFKFLDWSIAYLKGYILNMVIPYSGLAFRANHLKITLKVSYLEYLGAIYIFSIAGLVLMLALASLYLTVISNNIIYVITLIIALLLIYFKFHLINKLNNINFRIKIIDKIFEKINIAGVILLKTKNNKNIKKFLIIFTAGAIIDFIAFAGVIYLYPMNLTMTSLIIIYLSYSLSWVVRFTPGNIGTQEIIISFASVFTGYGALNGVILSISLRAISFISGIITLATLIIFSEVLNKSNKC